MQWVAAGFAAKRRLSWAVAAFAMLAAATSLTGMPWVFLDDSDTGQGHLVADQGKELGKRPGVQHAVDLAGQLQR